MGSALSPSKFSYRVFFSICSPREQLAEFVTWREVFNAGEWGGTFMTSAMKIKTRDTS